MRTTLVRTPHPPLRVGLSRGRGGFPTEGDWLMSLLILTLVAAHEGEEFVIILPAVMLVGAFFILRWAN